MNWNYFTFAKTHPGKLRPYNEDAVLDMSESSIWVVADGMGGHSAGDVASQMLVDRIARYIKDVQNTNIDDIRAVVQSANLEIYQYAQTYLDGKTMGTTLVLLFFQDSYYHCLWVGDSRIYQLRNDCFVQKTRDHSQVMDLVEQGLLAFEDAESHPLSNVITRAIGVDDTVRIDQISGSLEDGDQFLLCSDGLSKELSNDELRRTLCADSVNQAGLALMHSALVRGARDNVTCALIKVCRRADEFDSVNRDDLTIPVYMRNRSYD